MNTTLKKITAEAKRIRKRHPGKAWKSAVKEAGKKYREGKLPGAKKRKPATRKKAKARPRKKVGALTTKSKSHVDRNRFKNVDIQIGSATAHLGAAKKALVRDLGGLEAKRFVQRTKTAKKKITKRIQEVRARLRKLM